MITKHLIAAALMVSLFLACSYCNAEQGTNDNALPASKGVLTRLIGDRADDFLLETIPGEKGLDVYEYEAKEGKVRVRGSSGVAILRGAYDYLRQTGSVHVSWEGNNVQLPKIFPDAGKTRVVCPYKLRLLYNVCAFGYTSVYWDWERWEKELDWMALHGINMPLAYVGQEAIWKRVWKKMGITDEELDVHFTGPAFLPWHRMGNINNHHGPIPESWHGLQIELQKKIMNRMRDLGMKPLAPGFAGYVPKALERVRPKAKIITMEPFAGFPKKCETYVLNPEDPLFPEIGRMFVQEYKKEYGDVEYYLVDSFNEMKPPVGEETRYEDLAKFGLAAFNSVKAGNPKGKWVLQGWMFQFDRRFWDKRSVRAFFSKVPDDETIVIDLNADIRPQWSKHDAFYGKKWIYSTIHNFGGINLPFGDLNLYATQSSEVLKNPKRGKLIGYGISPEGTENNSVVYELLCDAAWTSEEIDLKKWLQDYCEDRYGECPPEMEKAWELLSQTVYSRSRMYGGSFMRHPRPVYSTRSDDNRPKIFSAINLFLSCGDDLGESYLYQRDVVDLVMYHLSGVIDNRIAVACMNQFDGDKEGRDRAAKEALDLMTELDALIDTRAELRLSRWVNYARAYGRNEKEAAYYESDAKMQVTVWGGHQLSGYAAKAWSGLIRDFYVPRWTYFFENMRRKDRGEEEVNILDWDLEWVAKKGVSSMAEPVDDPVKEARRLMKKYGGKLIAIEWQKLGTLEGSEISSKFKPLEWDATSFVDGAGRYNVQFYREWGYNSLEIEWVALIENGKEIARDKHLGRASRRSRNNIYRLDMNEFKDGVKYIIRASVRGEDETIIHGGVSIRKSKLPEKTPAEQGKQAS